MVASHAPPTGDLARNPGMSPDWDSNQRPFGLQAGAQSTEPHQPGLYLYDDFIILVLLQNLSNSPMKICTFSSTYILPKKTISNTEQWSINMNADVFEGEVHWCLQF